MLSNVGHIVFLFRWLRFLWLYGTALLLLLWHQCVVHLLRLSIVVDLWVVGCIHNHLLLHQR